MEELDELDLLQKPEIPRSSKKSRGSFRFPKRKEASLLEEIQRKRWECVVCLQVHRIKGLPQSLDDRSLVVGWRTAGWKGELTLPVQVKEGVAAFDEVFLHYCDADVVSALKNVSIWVSMVDAGDCGLGAFGVDLSECLSGERPDSVLAGTSLRFELGGAASGAELSASAYSRMVDAEIRKSKRGTGDSFAESDEQKQSKCRCFPCLADFKHQKNHRPLTISTKMAPSLRSDPGFITLENLTIFNHSSLEKIVGEDGDFIETEKRTMRSRRALQSTPQDTTDDESCFRSAGCNDEDCDTEGVEDEFLSMLEWGEEEEIGCESDFDLESLIEIAEVEMAKAARLWKGRRVGGAILEEAEYEDLRRKWASNSGFSCAGVDF